MAAKPDAPPRWLPGVSPPPRDWPGKPWSRTSPDSPGWVLTLYGLYAAGAAYVVWVAFAVGVWYGRNHAGN